MIKQLPTSPPTDFATRVQQPGLAWIASNPGAPAHKMPNYWSRVKQELYNVYSGICHYCASWTPLRQSGSSEHATVDHYVPRAVDRNLAYEWSNYRLCRRSINEEKKDKTNIIDPFAVSNDWFVLNFKKFSLAPSDGLPDEIESDVRVTIDELKLNSRELRQERRQVVIGTIQANFRMKWVENRYPFIYKEMVRVDFENTIGPQIRAVLEKHGVL